MKRSALSFPKLLLLFCTALMVAPLQALAWDRGEVTRCWDVDWYSSGATFDGWQEQGSKGLARGRPPAGPPMVVSAPGTWFLREGWMQCGSISYREVPSAAS